VANAWWFDLRNRLLSSARFRSTAEKIPLIRKIAQRRAGELFTMASGFIHSQVLASCVRLGLFDLLRTQSLTVEQIAAHADMPGEPLAHLLRAAAALRLLETRPGGRYGLGVLGAAVVDNPGLAALIEHHEHLYKDLAEPLALFAGQQRTSQMQDLWAYATSASPDTLESQDVARYTELMSTSQTMVAEQVLGAYSMRDHSSLLDIGGGSGAFLTAVHQRWPHLTLTLADLPAVAEIAADKLREAGLAEAIHVVGADATRDALPRGADLVSLVRILHDHDEATVERLLATARETLAPGGTLLIAEPLADAPGAGPLIDAYFNVYLLAMGSGRPRRFDELEGFIRAAGFDSVNLLRTRIPLITSVLTARRPD